MTYLPSLYKARGIPVKSPVCAICLDRTRGKALERELTHGVRVWLCEGHHSVAFLRRNAGRDFVVTLARIWRSNGCLTRARSHALDAHLARSARRAVRRRGRGPAPTPGRACAAKPSSALPVVSESLPTIARSVIAMPAITPPSRASAPCADGSATAVGSALRRTTTRISPNSPGATRRRPCRSREPVSMTAHGLVSSRRGPRRGRAAVLVRASFAGRARLVLCRTSLSHSAIIAVISSTSESGSSGRARSRGTRRGSRRGRCRCPRSAGRERRSSRWRPRRIGR